MPRPRLKQYAHKLKKLIPQLKKLTLAKQARLGLLVALVGFGVDRASKVWLLDVFHLAQRAKVKVTSFFDLVLVWNEGISYGSLSFLPPIALIIITGAIILFLLYLLLQEKSLWSALALGLIIGGALGNLYDRVIFGAVIDYISLHLHGFYWYVFNMADVAITFGALLLLVHIFFQAKPRDTGEK